MLTPQKHTEKENTSTAALIILVCTVMHVSILMLERITSDLLAE